MKAKPTPEHPIAVYVQSPPALIHLLDEILIELALLQYRELLLSYIA